MCAESSRARGARHRPKDGSFGGGLLRGDGEGSREVGEGGDVRSKFLPSFELDRHYLGVNPESPWPERRRPSSGTSLSGRLWETGHWRHGGSWSQRTVDLGRVPGAGLGVEPGRDKIPGARRRRVGRSSEERRRAASHGSGSGRKPSWRRDSQSPFRPRGEEGEKWKEEEKKGEARVVKEEEEERVRGPQAYRRQEANAGIHEAFEEPLRWHRVGPKGKSQEEGFEEGQEIPFPSQKGQGQQYFGREDGVEQFKFIPGGGHSDWTLQRDFKGSVGGGKVPWSSHGGKYEVHEGNSFDPAGGVHRGYRTEGGCGDVLQAALAAESHTSCCPGDVDVIHGHRFLGQRKGLPSNGYFESEAEECGGHGIGHPLECLTEDGDPSDRRHDNCPEPRASTCAERKLSGEQKPVVGFPTSREEAGGQGEERKGRPRARTRDERKRQGSERCKRRRKRRREGKRDEELSEKVSLLPQCYEGMEEDEKKEDAPAKSGADGKGWGVTMTPRSDSFLLPDQDFKSLGQEVAGIATDVQLGLYASDTTSGIPPPSGKKYLLPSEDEVFSMKGLTLTCLGGRVFQRLLEVLPLCSQPMEGKDVDRMFPLPTSRTFVSSQFPELSKEEIEWLLAICVSLNSIWGGKLFSERSVTVIQQKCLNQLKDDVIRLRDLSGAVSPFDWKEFFSTRTVDYHGEEVKTARIFSWANIAPALPKEIGRVPLQDLCEHGARYYVNHFDQYILDEAEWGVVKAPKVMVRDEDWSEVCRGLLSSGVCTVLPREELFHVRGEPLLNGLFGVTKEEHVNGIEVYRLIMNLVPLNNICHGFSGDVATLPAWSSMSPYFLQPSENLLVSSEDVRCFFYVLSVPECWYKYLGFNRPVPSDVLPEDCGDSEMYLCSRVLPMGFLNSVSLAQHVHRCLVRGVGCPPGSVDPGLNMPQHEVRKDRTMPVAPQVWRVYLDNFDLLEKVKATEMVQLEGSIPPGVLALRSHYEYWDVPRNLKKAVHRASVAEVQGATVDGQRGMAFPREAKLLKYIAAGYHICGQKAVSQRQMQVVCGGLVYVAMFRRPLLGGLNAVWRFIESFNASEHHYQPLWPDCKLEILRFLCLVPLARMSFRAPVHPSVTCSDASTSGGGICVSHSLTPYGKMVSRGGLRGQLAENRTDHQVLSIGLFDGIGALRVALDLLEVSVLGHISVEANSSASRVVESHFPTTQLVTDVRLIDEKMIRNWATQFSQCSLVLIGAGPPCQGVSGLNASRQGALRDSRSSLFQEVSRVRDSVKREFKWCPVHTLMESVASMDSCDQEVMSKDFGEDPWEIDAGHFTWCRRPRLYWLTWDPLPQEGVVLLVDREPRRVCLASDMDLDSVCQDGWTKVDPNQAFPTFTTSRPRSSPGRKPAGISQCTDEELQRWREDSYRFPPYQYRAHNCLVNKNKQLRLPSVEEKEIMMGFPRHYTAMCMPKGKRHSADYTDCRHTLIGNSWSVPVVSYLLQCLLAPLGLCREHTPGLIIQKLTPGPDTQVQTMLFRQPLRKMRASTLDSYDLDLAFRLSNLVSIKGEDIMISSTSQEQVKFHRLRASVPSKLWHWKVVSGWKWTKEGDHINVLELRAILTTLKWRICHQHHLNCRFLHLTDSLVCLHSMSRGRSSSRKLRRTMSRINALLLVSSSTPLLGYVHTDQNPADRPSRWGRRIKTKFRNA